MDTLLNAGVSASAWLQATYPQLKAFMSLVSDLGNFDFYLALILLIYWGIHKQQGQRLAYVMAVGSVLINVFKHLLQGPRPFWLDPSLSEEGADGFGVPSGHVTSATMAYFFIAGWVRQRWAWGTAVFLVALMALSRVYLGVHFLHDVGTGFVLGAAVLAGYTAWMGYAHGRYQALILGQRFLIVIGVPITLGLLYAMARLIQGPADLSMPWASYVPQADLNAIEDNISALAILMGLGMGFVLESSRVRFVVEAETWRKIIRYFLGAAVAMGLLFGLRTVFAGWASPDIMWWYLTLRFVRYWLVAMWGAFYAPMLFVKLGLATAEPAPKMTASINKLK